MNDADRTPKELLQEVARLRGRLAALERVEAEHKEDVAAYRALVDESLQGLIILQDKRLVFANDTFAGMNGCTVAEMLAMTPRQVEQTVHPEDRQRVAEYYQNRLTRQPGPDRIECRLLRKDGSVLWTEVYARPVQYNGRPGVQVALIDIESRKQTEEDLRESEEKWRSLTATSPDYIMTLDRRGTVLSVNRDIDDFRSDQIVGRCVFDMMSVGDWRQARAVFERAFEAGESGTSEVEYLGLDGVTEIQEVVVGPIWRGDRVAAVSVSCRNVTDRKLIEQRLRESERSYRSLVEQSQDCVWRTDRELRITFVSPAVKRMLGYEPEELIGKSFERVVTPEGVLQAREMFEKRLRGELPAEGITLELPHRRKDGTVMLGEIRSAPILDAEGRLLELEGITRDVTARKRIEEAYRSLVDHSLQGLCIQQDGRIVFANQRFSDMIGFSIEEMLAAPPETVRDRVHPDDRPTVWSRMRDRLAGKDVPERYEFRMIRKDGTVFWLEMYGTLVQFRDRPASQTAFIDITDRKRAEEALRESERRFRAVFDTARDSIFIKDRDLRYTHVNPAMEKLFGAPASDLVGRTDEDLFGDEAGRHIREVDERVLAGVVVEVEDTKPVGGKPLTFHVVKVPMHDNAGGVVGLCGIARDVTRRRTAQEALRESEERYRTLVENASDIIYTGDLETGRVTSVNAAASRILGFTRQEALGRDIDEYLPLRQRRISNDMSEQKMQGEPSTRYELEIPAKDGRLVPVEINSWLIFKGGRPVAFQGIARDITERKQAAEALARRLHHEEGLAKCSQILLADTESAMDEALGQVLRISDASRVYVFENFQDATDGLCHRQTHEVCAPGIPPRVDNPRLRHVPYTGGFRRWVDEMLQGRPIHGLVEGFDEDVRGVVEPLGVLSILLIPVSVEGRWHGFIGFDETRTRRQWSREDVRLLQTAAEMIGNYLDRRRAREALQRAHDQLEQRVAERTAALARANEELRGEITHRKQAEEATRVFARSMEQSRDGIVITDAESRITFLNRAAQEAFGLAGGEVMGQRLRDVFQVNARTNEEIAAGLRAQRSWSGLLEVACATSGPLTIDLTRLEIADERGATIATVNIFRDARELRRLESLQRMAEDAAGAATADQDSLRRVMTHVRELAGTDIWAIYLHDPDSDTVKLHASSESAHELVGEFPEVALSGTPVGQAFKRSEIVRSPDVLNDPQFTGNPSLREVLPIFVRLNIRAVCLLPIRSGARVIGTLHLADRRARVFAPEELNALRTLASQIAIILSQSDGAKPEAVRSNEQRRSGTVPIIAESKAMKAIVETSEQFASTDLPVLILGPTGAGKGHLARYIHSIGSRANEPFLAVNCACLDGELILSELFGHERGAFTGAMRRQKGCFELAHGGTLLLDEVIELPGTAQAKLLQVVESQQFRRLGGQEAINTNVRIICTTNADIRECVRGGKFRQDLYYRLNAAEIVIPPLCSRIEDIEPLALAYLRVQALAGGGPACKLTDGALARLREYHWPGNIRELQNVLTQAMAQTTDIIGSQDLRFSPVGEPKGQDRPAAGMSERDMILDALRRHHWNRSLAAEALGIHRNTLRERMRKHNIVG
ncbi:MAG: PAS domain S-box protein [Phycisphaerae bacterium]|nr:PAS domain S-box protein [Phycisphaerae bacterium]